MNNKQDSHNYIKATYGAFSNSRAENVCVFSHYDTNNNVATYVLQYLKTLKSCACDIVFVSTADKLGNNLIEQLLEHCKIIIIRHNIGYDFGSYKCGIDYVDDFKKYNKLILANDSVYGPLYDLEPLITFGEKNNLDVWGATDSYEISYHIQSYFLVYNNTVITSPSFKKFWNNVAYLSNETFDFKMKIIENYEIGGSSHFIAHGFKLGALCNNNDTTHYVINNFFSPSPAKPGSRNHPHLYKNINNTANPTHFYWDIIIEKFRFPFIKRELLMINPLNINIEKWPALIQKTSSLHYSLIIEHLKSVSQTKNKELFKWFFESTKTKSGISIPYFLTQILTIWPDLKEDKGINFSTETGVLNAIAWWENPGRFSASDINWPQSNSFPDAIYQSEIPTQKDDLLEITKGAAAVLRTRKDLNHININTIDGRKEFLFWRLTQGSKEYRFLRFTNKEITYLLSPRIALQGKLKHFPNVSQLLTYIAKNDKGILDLLENHDLKTYENQWQQSKDFLLKVVSDNASMLSEVGIKENKFTTTKPLGTLSPYGINTIGFPRAYIGIAEDVRTATQSLLQANIPTAVCSVPLPLITKTTSSTSWIENFIRKEPTYKLNLINLPATDTFHLLLKGWSGLFSNRYNIAAWQWELPHWPEKWLPLFNLIDEIWAISHFTEEIFKKYTDKPVIYMPLAIDKPSFKAKPRSLFNIPINTFVYLSVFDCNSWIARKNPIAAVKAFTLAFPSKDTDVHLVVKVMNSNSKSKEFIELMDMVKQDNRILMIDETLSRNDMLALINCCDVFVSLHRSEGFGRVIAESMLLGKPVISTNFSGSLDFAHEGTAFIVDGPIVKLKPGDYVDFEGQYWMDPDINTAAEQFRICYEDTEKTAIIAERGQLIVEENHSIKACATRYAARLKEIGKIKGI